VTNRFLENNDYEVVEEDSSSEDTLKTPKLFEKTEYGFNQYNDKGQLIKEVTGVKTHKFQYHDNGRVSIHFEEFIYQGNERKREIQYNDLGKEIRKTETHDFGIDGEIDKTEEHIYE